MTKYLFSREGFISAILIGAAMLASSMYLAGSMFIIVYMIAGWVVISRNMGVKRAFSALILPTAFVAMFTVPSFFRGFDEATRAPSSVELRSREQTFEVLCNSWRNGNWIDRTIGQYSGQRWCRDYVHRLPPVSDETTTSTEDTGNLWK